MGHKDDSCLNSGPPLLWSCVLARGAVSVVFPEDSQGSITTSDCGVLSAGGEKWRNSARKNSFWPIWPKIGNLAPAVERLN